MNRGEQRSAAAAGERQRKPVEVVVDEIELSGTTQRARDVHRLPHPSVDGRVVRVPARADPVK